MLNCGLKTVINHEILDYYIRKRYSYIMSLDDQKIFIANRPRPGKIISYEKTIEGNNFVPQNRQ